MAQSKKTEIRGAILAAAHDLFGKRGYHAATLRQISARAGVSLANVYVYFDSKLDIIFAIYGPWFTARIARLEAEASKIADRRARLRHIIATLWRDIPAEDNGFARNIMQALSTAGQDEAYDPSLIRWAEARIAAMVAGCVTPRRGARPTNGTLAHVLLMAFDGFAMNERLNPRAACSEATIDLVCDMILASGRKARRAKSAPARKAPAPKAKRTAKRRVKRAP